MSTEGVWWQCEGVHVPSSGGCVVVRFYQFLQVARWECAQSVMALMEITTQAHKMPSAG